MVLFLSSCKICDVNGTLAAARHGIKNAQDQMRDDEESLCSASDDAQGTCNGRVEHCRHCRCSMISIYIHRDR